MAEKRISKVNILSEVSLPRDEIFGDNLSNPPSFLRNGPSYEHVIS